METKRFRNHISAVVEQAKGFLVIIMLIVFELADDLIEIIMSKPWENMDSVDAIYILAGAGILIVAFILYMVWRLRVWSKTWIVLDEETISVEKNTLISKKATIGIKNISNINAERNIFEMLIGTCNLKINTNSMTTANETDIKIILKKKEAEELKAFLVKKTAELNCEEKQPVGDKEINDDSCENDYDVKADLKDVLFNGLFSVGFGATLVLFGGICGFVLAICEIMDGIVSAADIGTMVIIVFAGILYVVLVAMGQVKNLFKIYDFRCKRVEDKINIKYGLFKKADFSIPVDKINALVINQTVLARILGMYSAEIVKVGIGDEKNENTYFVLYCKKDKLLATVNKLLPEFSDALETDCEKQPKSVWIILFKNILICCAVLGIAAAVAFNLDFGYFRVMIVCGIFIAIYKLLSEIISYYTEGISISSKYLGVRRGSFGTSYTIVKYKKIQFITFHQGLISRKLNVMDGVVHILAKTDSSVYRIPYIKKEKSDMICSRFIS